MKPKNCLPALILAAAALFSTGCTETERIIPDAAPRADLREEMKKSLVYLNVSARSYEMLQPWRPPDSVERNGFACAVAPYEVITTALNVADASLIKVRVHGQNEFAPASVKAVDYECNLALLHIDPDQLSEPLVPLKFTEHYRRGAPVDSYWLGSNGDVITGRGHLDRAEVNRCQSSFTRFLDYVVAGTSTETGKGRLFCIDGRPTAIACWANSDKQETGLIPACTINHFLRDVAEGDYAGFGITGFVTEALTDPGLRSYIGLPADVKHGVYIRNVHRIGMGSDLLRQGDVLAAIDHRQIDAYGYYEDDLYGRLSYEHLVNIRAVGDTTNFTVFRDGRPQTVSVPVTRFDIDEMLIPYHAFDTAPEYIVTAGYVIQKLTRDYLGLWGDSFGGKAPPHLYHYYRTASFNPAPDRRDVVILSVVLPAEINRGYHGLGRLVISTYNGMPITRLADVLEAQKINPDSPYDIIEFEQDSPTVVIPRAELDQANTMIAARYGIPQLVRVNP